MPGPTDGGRQGRLTTLRHRVVEWGARRPTAVAALLYLVLAFALVSPGLAPGRTLSSSDYFWTATPWDSSRPAAVPPLGANREQGDAVNKFQPSLEYTRHQLPGLSLWDPHVLSGRPYVADPQTQLWSPFSVPSYVLPFWKSLAVSAALKLFVAALGAFLLARALGMRFGGALMTGLAFGFSLWCVRWVSWNIEGSSCSSPGSACWRRCWCEDRRRWPGPGWRS